MSYENVDGHTEYLVKVLTREQGEWQFKKRYSRLRDFHEHLKKTCPHLPHFPPKKLFGNMQATFLQQRRKALEDYFRDLCVLPEVHNNETFKAFIKPRDAVVLSAPPPTSPRALDSPTVRAQQASSNQEKARRKEQQMNRISEEVSDRFINLSSVPSPLDEEDVGRKRHEYTRELDRDNARVQWKALLPTSQGDEVRAGLSLAGRGWTQAQEAGLLEALEASLVQVAAVVIDLRV